MPNIIQLRRDTSANWDSVDPVLAEGEIGINLDTDQFKIGNGIDIWSDLTYFAGGGTWGSILGTLSNQTDLQNALNAKVPTSRTLTINGSAYDLSADRSWTITAGVWGQITGTLSNQTDLQNALNALVPYTGATGDVTLGEHGLTTGFSQFDTTPSGADAVGRLIWNDTDGTLNLGLKGGNVSLQIGQESVVRVVNKTGSTLNQSAYQVVKVSTAQGQRLGVALAQANNDNNSADTLGIVTETITNNQEGFITVSGIVNGINTTGSLQSETWADGDVLYLSGTTAGAITNVKPSAPIHLVKVGYVVYAHATNGKIYVDVINGFELNELHDVSISSPTNGQVLIYNSTSSLWENGTGGGSGTVTSVGMTVPTGLTISGSPITSSGTLALTFTAGYSIPTTTKQSNWDDAYTFVGNFPTQTGNTGKYLTTDGSALSWGTITGFYTNNGTLTSNRTVTMSTYTLTFSGNTTIADKISIGASTADTVLSVYGENTTWGTASFSPNAAKGTRVSHIHYGINGDVYLRSASTSGVVYLQSDGGDFVIGNSSSSVAVNGILRPRMATNRQTSSYTLVLTDEGKTVEMNVASANNLTVPLNSSVAFPIGTQILIAQYGAGQTTIVATSGVTLRSDGSKLKINSQYSGATLIKIATDEWYVFGNLSL